MTDSLPLYLASSSPRRRQLLRSAQIAYDLFVVPVDEDALSRAFEGPLHRLGAYLAECKARAAIGGLRVEGKRGRVLASDTTVLLDGVSLSKPRDEGEARHMLDRLRGREHIVATGVALGSTESDALIVATSETRVLMRDYGADEVAAYVASGDAYDKAGGYSIQHQGFEPVARFTGCHLGVIGLPVCIVAALLSDSALPPPTADGSCRWSPLCTTPYPSPEDIRTVRSAGEPP
jgi:septum formation protein